MFVVVTGLPASGKTTLGRALSTQLGLPMFDKDDLLESLFPEAPVSADERARLSRMADDQLQSIAALLTQAILVSWWRTPGSSSPSGTPTEWLPPLSPIEVHCRCAPEVAVERFFDRSRHPGHGDERWTDRDVAIERFAAQAVPLGLGPLVEVSTDADYDAADVARQVLRVAP